MASKQAHGIACLPTWQYMQWYGSVIVWASIELAMQDSLAIEAYRN